MNEIEALAAIANAICQRDALPAPDPYADDAQIGSLTEAAISISRALNRIADALESVADAIDHKEVKS